MDKRLIFICVVYWNSYCCVCLIVSTNSTMDRVPTSVPFNIYIKDNVEMPEVTAKTSTVDIFQVRTPSTDILLDTELRWKRLPRSLFMASEDSFSVTQMAPPLTTNSPLPVMPIERGARINLLVKQKEKVLEEDNSLARLLTTLVQQNLRDCNLIILTERSFLHSSVLETLIRLPNMKEFVFMEDSDSLLERVVWLSRICQGIILLITDPEPLLRFGGDRLFSWDYRAKVIIAGLEKEAVLRFLQTKKGKKSENIVALFKEGRPNHFSIYMNELYWGNRRLRFITEWKGRTFTLRTDMFPDKISNLQQALLNVAVFEWQPAIFYRRDKENNIILRYGRDVDVVFALTEALNFTFVYKETEDLFGTRLENGSFNGQVGQMYNGEGDIGIANIWLSSLAGRNEFQDYSSIFEVDNNCIMARVEPPLPLWQSPALPFQPQAWLAIGVFMIFSGPLLYVLARLGSVKEPEEKNLRSLPMSILYSVGVHISHPMSVMPRNPTTQVYIVFFLLYGLILNTGYTSNLISFLTLPKEPYSIQTFKEIYKSGMTFVGIPYMKDAMEFSNNPYLKEMVSTYDVRMRFEDWTEDILAGRAVSLNSKSYLELRGGIVTGTSKKSKFRILKECLAFYSVGIVYQKHSPLKIKFDHMITRMFESGIVRQWFYNSMKLYHQYERKDAREEQLLEGRTMGDVHETGNLRIAHVQGVFILMICGIIVSVMVFAVEICV